MARSKKRENGFLDYLDELLDELHHSIPRAIREFDSDAIHDARVATRRLKAAMTLLEFVLTKERRDEFEKVLKKIRKRLGPLRDLDVMIERLGELSSHPAHGMAAKWLGDHLKRERDETRNAAQKKGASADVLAKLGAWWHVREQISDAGEAVDSLLAQSLHLQLDAFAERAQAIVSKPESPASQSEKHDPHQLRIAGKLLRYTLELAEAQGHDLPSTVLGGFKKMQEALGNWHDDVVLVQCAMQRSLDEGVAYHDLAVQERLLDLNRHFLRRAARELENFAKLWRKRGAEVARAVREKFPLTRPVSESKTGPDPSGSNGTPAPVALPPDVVSPA
jgi:CHAD domain-containing protein